MSTMDWSVLTNRNIFFGGGGQEHFGLKAQSSLALFFLCLLPSLGLNFYKGEKEVKKGVGGEV